METIGRHAFANMSALTKIVIPNSVVEIGANAFYQNKNLVDVTLSENIKKINGQTFSSCGIKTITIPEGVESINDWAFQSTPLETITIPDSVTYIATNTFEGASNLTEIHIPTKVVDSISGAPWSSSAAVYWQDIYNDGQWLFDKTSKTITKYLGTAVDVTMPNSFDIDGTSYDVQSFNMATFRQNTNIERVVLPEGMIAIPTYAFNGCTKLEEVVLPDGLASISDCAFRDCTKLSKINLVNSLKSIGTNAFTGCSGLREITIPDSVVTLGNNAFSYMNLEVINIGSGIATLPSGVFQMNKKLQTITIPDTVTSIGASAFSSCSVMVDITIPDSIKTIGSNAFANCTSLKIINIPGLDSGKIEGEPWGSSAVVNWRDVVVTEDWVYSPGESMITKYLGTAVDVVVPKTIEHEGTVYQVKSLATGVFRGNTTIKTVEILDGITELPDNTFNGCTALTSVNIKRNTTVYAKWIESQIVLLPPVDSLVASSPEILDTRVIEPTVETVKATIETTRQSAVQTAQTIKITIENTVQSIVESVKSVVSLEKPKVNVTIKPDGDNTGDIIGENPNKDNTDDEKGVFDRPGFGGHEYGICIVHWVLWALSAMMVIAILFKRNKNEKDIEDLMENMANK